MEILSLQYFTSWLGTSVFKLLATRRRKNREQVAEAQRKTLLNLVRKAQQTRFGKEHEFVRIHSIEDYQSRVRVRDYDQFWEDYWSLDFPNLNDVTWPGKNKYFAKTSGTTLGVSKFIPCSMEMIKANNRAGLQVLYHHFRRKPQSRMLYGRYFAFTGNPNLEELAPNVFAGELSGIASRETPSWAGKDRYYPPYAIASISDWQEKLERVSVDCLDEDIRAISGLPSWLQILFARIFDQNPDASGSLKKLFPELELLVFGGMSVEPYWEYFTKITEGMDVDFREVYAASEGFFAVADRDQGDGMRLITDNGIFYEFIPVEVFGDVDTQRLTIGSVQNEVDYVLVVSTCAGLWSYVVGDIIRFVDVEQLRLVFSGRLSQTLSEFGEKILTKEIEAAIAAVMQNHRATLSDYAVSSVVEANGKPGHHVYLIELQTSIDAISPSLLASEIDGELIKSNSGYATRRKGNIAILPPKVVILRKGTFEKWMEENNKAGGQHKVPRMLSVAKMNELLELSGSKY